MNRVRWSIKKEKNLGGRKKLKEWWRKAKACLGAKRIAAPSVLSAYSVQIW